MENKIENTQVATKAFNPNHYVDKPDRFYGYPSENPLLWLRNVGNWMEAVDMEDYHALKIVPTFLKGNAATWWDMEKKNVKDWSTFKIRFQDFFISTDIEEAWWSELENVKQGQSTVNES